MEDTPTEEVVEAPPAPDDAVFADGDDPADDSLSLDVEQVEPTDDEEALPD